MLEAWAALDPSDRHGPAGAPILRLGEQMASEAGAATLFAERGAELSLAQDDSRGLSYFLKLGAWGGGQMPRLPDPQARDERDRSAQFSRLWDGALLMICVRERRWACAELACDLPATAELARLSRLLEPRIDPPLSELNAAELAEIERRAATDPSMELALLLLRGVDKDRSRLDHQIKRVELAQFQPFFQLLHQEGVARSRGHRLGDPAFAADALATRMAALGFWDPHNPAHLHTALELGACGSLLALGLLTPLGQPASALSEEALPVIWDRLADHLTLARPDQPPSEWLGALAPLLKGMPCGELLFDHLAFHAHRDLSGSSPQEAFGSIRLLESLGQRWAQQGFLSEAISSGPPSSESLDRFRSRLTELAASQDPSARDGKARIDLTHRALSALESIAPRAARPGSLRI